MKDGVILANSGHFDVEIDKKALAEKAVEVWERKPNITGYRMEDGRILNLMAEGRLVNLAAGNGHPAEIMDMSFADSGEEPRVPREERRKAREEGISGPGARSTARSPR